MKQLVLDGVAFRTSLMSQKSRNCVGVGTKLGRVLVTNTKHPSVIVDFSKQEWLAFLDGVKKGEFEITELEK
jgi:hypothetical protein